MIASGTGAVIYHGRSYRSCTAKSRHAVGFMCVYVPYTKKHARTLADG